jgi:pyruvate/2-oxoglutarate dehydrogenase complex dihydrolipoamide dehydrogenase (E3) component
LREKPKKLLVLGGGLIGCELAQAFTPFDIEVTLVEILPRIMIREDEEVSVAVMDKFKREGMQVLVEHTAKQFLIENGEMVLIAEHNGQQVRITFDQVLLAIGRAANVSGYGVEELGIELSPRKTLAVNPFLPNIFACGDVAGPYQLLLIRLGMRQLMRRLSDLKNSALIIRYSLGNIYCPRSCVCRIK